jgi:hypothetical protein
MLNKLSPLGGITLPKPPQIGNLLSGIKIPKIPFLGDITKPYPTPPKAKQPTKTKFDKTPFSEINLIDPFKTSELAILTEDLLAVDKIGDVLGKFLPPELVEELSSLQDFATHLLDQGKDMVGTVMELADKIPNGLNLSELLRDTPIMSVIENIDSINDIAGKLGIDLSSFSQDGLKSIFSFLDGFKSSGDSTAGNNDSNATTILSSLGFTVPNIGDIAMKTAVVSGAISSIVGYKVNMNNTYKNLGVSSVSSVTGVTNLLSSNGFTQLVNNLNVIGKRDINKLAYITPRLNFVGNSDYIRSALKLPVDTVNLLTGLNPTKLDSVRTYASLTQQYGATAVSVSTKNLSCYTEAKLAIIRDIYTLDPTFSLNETISQFATHTTSEIQQFQTEVAQKGVTQYALDNPNKFTAEIALVTKYGNVIVDISLTAITNINRVDGTQRLTDSGIVILLGVMVSVGVPTAVKLSNTSDISLSLTLSAIDTYGPTLLTTTLSELISIVTNNTDLEATITAIVTVVGLTGSFSGSQLEQTFTSLLEITPKNLSIIQNKLSVTEVSTIITMYEIDGLSLQHLLKETTKQAAIVGDKKTILNLIGTYPDILTNDYLRYLVETLLEHYTLTKDDICMGTKLASINFVNSIGAILPNWWLTTRGSEIVYNHKPFINASIDSLLLLQADTTLGVDAILQSDNSYVIPPYLLH